ncbi:anti-sigma factor domain-containing protein [Pseudalkalibacillus sp. Hm43]|uniref:anti-sigma factor domain-containing protein n=1 Tax=Pseudalkalibacillus sp. Hm43 TaxID=3450742 RepID=UPI003F441FCE
MKRGLIMKVSKRKAVIMTKDGSFEQVRLKKGDQPEVGQEYICPTDGAGIAFRPNRVLLPSFSLALVALIVFVLVAGGMPFGHQKASAAAYVSFDINPSIEVAVDKEMNIIKVRALNEDAKSLLEGSDGYVDSSLLYFSESLFEMLEEYGYFDTYDDLLITSSFEKGDVSSELRKRLDDAIKQIRSDKSIENTSIVVSVMETSSDTRNKANELGLSMGKFLVYQDAMEQDESLEVNHVRTLSFSELRKLVAAGNEEEATDSTEDAALPKAPEAPALDHPVEQTGLKDDNGAKPINTNQTKENKETIQQKVNKSVESAAPKETPKEVKQPKTTAPAAVQKPKSDDNEDEDEEQREESPKDAERDDEGEENDREDGEREEEDEDGDNNVSRKDSKPSNSSNSSEDKDEEGLKLKINIKIGERLEKPAEHLKQLDLLKIQFIHNKAS